MIWDWLRRHPRLVDAAVVAVLLAATAVGAGTARQSAAGTALDVVSSLLLLRRRQNPGAVAAAVGAATVALIAVGGWLLPFPLAIALYTLAAAGGPLARPLGAAAIAAPALALLASDVSALGDTAFHVVFAAAAWLLGDSIGSRRAYVREIEQKAERLEHERESEARRAAAEEQARIARELHDVVAHALSVIVVQAGAAADVFELSPERAREPIRAIDAAARAALTDLRRVLGILQEDARYEPQPGLDRLQSLVDQVRATGLDVSLEVAGAPRPLPAAVDLSAYRIVQEALTNTLKHAGAEHAKVRVRFGDEIRLEIADDGRGAVNGNGSGSGLIGMRERVAVLGGSVETGNAAGGGFVVTARIPV